MTKKEKIISFAWQHLLLFIALYIMTLGIAACVKSMLGASVISVLPYVFHDAGTGGLTPSLAHFSKEIKTLSGNTPSS